MRARTHVLIHAGVVAAIAVAAVSPLLIALRADQFAASHGCQVDEGSVHPCIVNGHDYGQSLYDQELTAWFAIGTLALGAIAITVYLGIVAVVYTTVSIRRTRRHQHPQPWPPPPTNPPPLPAPVDPHPARPDDPTRPPR